MLIVCISSQGRQFLEKDLTFFLFNRCIMAQTAIRDVSLTSHIRDPGARVRELCNYACKVEIDPQIPPRRYLRSGHEMLRMAKVYQDEKNYEQAFILYTKFIS